MATKQARGTKRTCQNCDERVLRSRSQPDHLPVLRHQICDRLIARGARGLQAEQREPRRRRRRSRVAAEDAEGELPAVEGEEALADVETDDGGRRRR